MNPLLYTHDDTLEPILVIHPRPHSVGIVSASPAGVGLNAAEVVTLRDWLNGWLGESARPEAAQRCTQWTAESVRCNLISHPSDVDCDFDPAQDNWPTPSENAEKGKSNT